MSITAFSHLNLRAPRPLLEELREFYCEVVGLTVGPRPPFRTFGYWLYAGREAVLHLAELASGETPELRAANTFDHVAFACTDLAAREQMLKTRNAAYKVARVPQSTQVQLFLRDPAGNGVELNFEECLPMSPIEALRKLDQEGAEAVRASDAAALDRLYATDHVLHYAPARIVRSREQVLEDVRQRRFSYSSFSRVVEHVSHQGEIGITIGREHAVTGNHPIHGDGQTIERRYTHIWHIEGGRWRLLVRHASDSGPA